MSSPGPTLTMAARKVRMGDVIHVDDNTYAVLRVVWLDEVGGQPLVIGFELEGGLVLSPLDPNDELDVTRPFARHAETGDHDL